MIIWISSYPKSGNTWVRSMIASLVYTEDGIFKFQHLDKIPKFPQKYHLEDLTSDLGNIQEVRKYWIASQDIINSDDKIKFLKTHHLNCNLGGYSFTNKKNTLATIYIVRDPRNLVSSISNHFSKSMDEAKKFLMTPRFIKGGVKKTIEENQLLTLIGTWGEHYEFWTKNIDNLLIIKYEDLIKDTARELQKIILFLKQFMSIKTDEKKNNNILNSTSFDELKKKESEENFDEAVVDKFNNKKNFFYLGPKNNWEIMLNKNIQKEIEEKFKEKMLKLGYLK